MKKRVIGIILIITILATSLALPAPTAGAATKFIYSGNFIKQLVQALKFEVDKNSNEPYLEAAVKAGIVKDEERKIFYFVDISRSDAAVFINRADEYLHGDTVNPELVKVILNKRISDIKKVTKEKREAVAKCFAKGLFVGYSNGYYIQNRKFKGDDHLTESAAESLIEKLINTKKRAKVSPDGMLIRTTKLPKNSKKYEYILACYPNKFYEKKFEFMLDKNWKNTNNEKYYIYPVNMKKATFKNWYDSWPLSVEMDKYLYDWANKAEKYLNYIFNVNYKTVDSKWVKELASCYVKSNIDYEESIKSYYLKHIKQNKVIVESSVISVEPSTFYKDGKYCIRAYIRYRIFAKSFNVDQKHLLYVQVPDLINLKNGEWRNIFVDVRFSSNDCFNGDGSDFAIYELTYFSDSINVPVE